MNKGIAIVISCEHASNHTGQYAHLFSNNEAVLETHRGYDPGASEIARAMSKELDAPLLLGTQSRLIIELNRTKNHPQLFSAYSEDLTDEEKKKLISDYYDPYSQNLKNLIAEGIKTHGHTLHLSVHSFTPILNGHVRTADIGILYDPARIHEDHFCTRWLRRLQDEMPGFTSLPNYPYLGSSDGLTSHFRTVFSDKHYMGIEIEVSQLHGAETEIMTDLLLSTLKQTLNQHGFN